jgi:RND family efflux transporter MFP subunit
MLKHSNIIISILLASMMMPAACTGDKKVETQDKVIPVKVINVVPSSIMAEWNYVGTVEESFALLLAFSNMGLVDQVFVSEGQKVGKGQALASLNTVTAQNAHNVSLSTLRKAQDAYDRLSKVHAGGSLPDIKLVEVETGLQQAVSAAAITQKSLDDCKIYAPVNGVITSRNIEAGENVMPGIAAFKLVSIDKVNVKISVPENEIGNVQTGQTASVTVPALGNAVFTGKIETKGILADAMSHAYEAKIGINNNVTSNAAPLLPGMVCKVSLTGDSDMAAFVVPNIAIRISSEGKSFVWIADGNVARRRFVKTGDLTNKGIIVVEGLSAGDRILVEGFQKISEGMKIKFDL